MVRRRRWRSCAAAGAAAVAAVLTQAAAAAAAFDPTWVQGLTLTNGYFTVTVGVGVMWNNGVTQLGCGTYSRQTTATSNGNTTLQNFFLNGATTSCVGLVPRESNLTLTCGPAAVIMPPTQPSSCHYLFGGTAPQLCAGFVPPSPTPSPSPTRTRSPSKSWTASQTRTRTASATVTTTATGTGTPTFTASPTPTGTATTTPTRTQTATGTGTATVTGTMTGTPSITASPSPAPLVIVCVEVFTQWAGGRLVGGLGLTALGYRTGGANTLTASPPIPLRNLTAINTTYMTAELDVGDAYWSTTTLTLVNAGFTVSVVKPPLAPPGGVAYTPPAVLAYGDRLRVNASGVGTAGPSAVVLRGSDGSAVPCAALVALPPDGLECTPLLVPDAAFAAPLVASIVFAPGTPAVSAWGAAITIPRPTLTLLPAAAVSDATASAVLSRHPPPATAWADAGLPAPRGWNGTRVVLRGGAATVVAGAVHVLATPGYTACAAAPLAAAAPSAADLRVTVRLAEALSVTARTSRGVAYAAPTLTAVLPATITITPNAASPAPLTLNFTLRGAGFGTPAAPRVREVELGGVVCGSAAVVNDSAVACTNWTAPLYADLARDNATDVQLTARLAWGPPPPSTAASTHTPVAPLLRALLRPGVLVVAPRLVQAGCRVSVLGTSLPPAAGDCAPGPCAPAALTITVGGAPCTDVEVASASAVVCTAPVAPILAPGYPTVAVAVTSAAGAAARGTHSATVTYTMVFTLAWDATLPAGGAITVLPAGRLAASRLPWQPQVALIVSGLGSGSCWLELHNVTLPPAAAVEGGALPAALVGSLVSPVLLQAGSLQAVLPFPDAGFSAPAGTTAAVGAQCLDANGAESHPPYALPLAVATLSAAWHPASVAALAGSGVVHAPAALPPATVVVAWTGVRDVVPLDYAAHFTCTAVVLAPGADIPPLAVPLEQVAASALLAGAVAAGTVASVCDTAGGGALNASAPNTTCWAIVLEGGSLAAAAAPDGLNLDLVGECMWEPTRERVRLPPLRVVVAGGSVSWAAVAAAVAAPVGELPLFMELPTHWPAAVNHSASHSGSAAGWCTLQTTGDGSGTLFLAGSGTQAKLPVADAGRGTGALAAPVTLAVRGAAGGWLDVRLVCTLWDVLVVATPPVRLRARSLSIRPLVALPPTFVGSDGVVPTTLRPPPTFAVVAAPDDTPVADTVCTLSTATLGAELRFVAPDGVVSALRPAAPDGNGTVAFGGVLVVTALATPEVLLTVTCGRAADDAPPPFIWLLAQAPLAMVVCTPPAAQAGARGALPPWAVAIVLANYSSSSEAARAATHAAACNASAVGGGVARDPAAAAAAALVQCDASVAQPPAGAGANRSAALVGFVSNAVAALVDGVGGPRTFGSLILLGTRGATYNLTAACSLGATPLPGAASWPVLVRPCDAGFASAGLVCTECAPGTFTLGNNEPYCIGCPRAGVTCSRGILTLLPNFFRPASENGHAVGPASQLLECFNIEACVMNASAATYGCAPGYDGALCGTCVEGHGMFGGYCRPCWVPDASRALLAFVILLFLGALAVVALRQSSGSVDKPAPIALKLLLGYVQAVSSLRVFKAAGTHAFRDAMGWTDSVSESPLSAGALQCQLQWPFLVRYAVTVALPLIAAGAALIIYSAVSALRAVTWSRCPSLDAAAWRGAVRAWVDARRPVSILVFVLFVAYMPIVSTSFRVLQCMPESIDRVHWLVTDLSVACYEGQHAVAATLAICVLALFGVGFPVGIYRIMAHATEEHLADAHFRNAFSFLYTGYKHGDSVATARILSAAPPPRGGGAPAPDELPRMFAQEAQPHARDRGDSTLSLVAARLKAAGRNWLPRRATYVWWESVILVRKAVVVLLSTVVQAPFYQVVGAVLLFSASIALQQRFQPYAAARFNRMEMLQLVSLYLTAAVSTLLLPSAVGAAPASASTTSAVTAVLITLNVGTVVALGVTVARAAVEQATAVATAALRKWCPRRYAAGTLADDVPVGVDAASVLAAAGVAAVPSSPPPPPVLVTPPPVLAATVPLVPPPVLEAPVPLVPPPPRLMAAAPVSPLPPPPLPPPPLPPPPPAAPVRPLV